MAIKSVISAKGQVTIPAPVRKALGLKPGDRISYKIGEGKAEFSPLKGTILDAAGSVQAKKVPEEFDKVRDEVRRTIAKKAAHPKR